VLQYGTVACWGANDSGQLGNGTTSPSATPVLVSGITTATHVTAGESHSCALLQDGSVECWGDDFYGELGNGHAGNGQSSSVPVAAEIFPTNPATEISAGGYNTCAVMQNRTVTCWGNGDHGQLGNGGVFPHDSSPVLVANINNATDVSTGLDYACAVRVDGGVSCWGSDLNAQLGSTTHITSFDVSTPVDVLGVAGATHVSAGSSATCATLANGTAACWGSGPLGDAPSDSPLAPTTVTGLPDS
jgi:alpha-tubulin suppressor-like RCC1 family protein